MVPYSSDVHDSTGDLLSLSYRTVIWNNMFRYTYVRWFSIYIHRTQQKKSHDNFPKMRLQEILHLGYNLLLHLQEILHKK